MNRGFVKNSDVSPKISLPKGARRTFGAQKSRSCVIVEIAVTRCPRKTERESSMTPKSQGQGCSPVRACLGTRITVTSVQQLDMRPRTGRFRGVPPRTRARLQWLLVHQSRIRMHLVLVFPVLMRVRVFATRTLVILVYQTSTWHVTVLLDNIGTRILEESRAIILVAYVAESYRGMWFTSTFM